MKLFLVAIMTDNHSNPLQMRSKILFVTGTLGVLLSLSLVSGLIWRQGETLSQSEAALKKRGQEGTLVRAVSAKKAPLSRPVELVGEAHPYATVTLYAKISGYLKEIKVDKGDQVEPDQIIAIIDSPELNRQYAGALADAANKRALAARQRFLLKTGAVSPQTEETADTAAQVQEENAAALGAQKAYEMMRAPFAGTVTARFADPGALVQSATSSQTAALPVVTISDSGRLRVYVYPDQRTATLVRIGDPVSVADATRPDIKVPATVTRTSGELDPKTRTLLVEIEVDNRDRKILAGSFVNVTLFVSAPPSVEIPASSLVIRGNKSMVGILTNEDKVTFREVGVWETDGRIVRLLTGVTEGERVILASGEAIGEGQKVRPVIVDF